MSFTKNILKNAIACATNGYGMVINDNSIEWLHQLSPYYLYSSSKELVDFFSFEELKKINNCEEGETVKVFCKFLSNHNLYISFGSNTGVLLPCIEELNLDSNLKLQIESKKVSLHILKELLEGHPIPTFVIDSNGLVLHWNKSCEIITKIKSEDVIGKKPWIGFYNNERPCLADLILESATTEKINTYYEKWNKSNIIPCGLEAEAFFSTWGENGLWLYFTAAPIKNKDGVVEGVIETLIDITERKNVEVQIRKTKELLEYQVESRTRDLEADIERRESVEKELVKRNNELTMLNSKLADAQQQLIQSEKLASIGQLAAGVAHEINNPVGFVYSNVYNLSKVVPNLIEIIEYSQRLVKDNSSKNDVMVKLKESLKTLDADFFKEDLPALVNESIEGLDRVKKIVQDLKEFSRADPIDDFQWSDLYKGLSSTLTIATNEIKYVADVVFEVNPGLELECRLGQLNQVFLNLLINSAHALQSRKERGKIKIKADYCNNNKRIFVEITDNGCGIKTEIQSKIFDPFFTTKPQGKGTGLGLSIAYGIIKSHNGALTFVSEIGKGTTFRVELPVRQKDN